MDHIRTLRKLFELSVIPGSVSTNMAINLKVCQYNICFGIFYFEYDRAAIMDRVFDYVLSVLGQMTEQEYNEMLYIDVIRKRIPYDVM
jgi:hypothetical protein